MRFLQIAKQLVLLGVRIRPWEKDAFANRNNAILIRNFLERLGSVFIKFGQMLALRPDFLPHALCDELYNLLDCVALFEESSAKQILHQELGKSVSDLYHIGHSPFASASFAQVYKARLKDGKTVAVKIQRPDIEQVVKKDIAIMQRFAKLYDFIFHPNISFSRIVTEFELWTKDELDYRLEAKNMDRFNNLESLVGDGIRAPKVYEALSTQKVLTMEYIEGKSLAEIIRSQKDRSALSDIEYTTGKHIMRTIIRNMLEMSHIYGFFHADPHPANIIVDKSGELVFIDFGIVGTLGKNERVLILRYLRLLLAGDADGSFRALLGLCGGAMPQNFEEVAHEYQLLVKKFTDTFNSRTYLEQQVKSGPVFAETLHLMERNGMVVPIGVIRYLKAFETIEGLIFDLYPELQIRDMAKEFRRVSIVNIVDAIPTTFEKADYEKIMLKVIESIENSFMLE